MRPSGSGPSITITLAHTSFSPPLLSSPSLSMGAGHAIVVSSEHQLLALRSSKLTVIFWKTVIPVSIAVKVFSE
jgi:hypothetical protein